MENQWQENLLTTQGKLMHTRVHDREQSEITNGVITIRSMPLRSLSLGLYGVADIVEFKPVETGGVTLSGYVGHYIPKPIEYKRGKSKLDDCDRVQLCAQALCLEEMLECRINEADIFYGETRRRDKFFIKKELRQKTIDLCHEMRKALISGITPAPEKTKACRRCSLQQLCLPKTSTKLASRYWRSVMKGLMDEP